MRKYNIQMQPITAVHIGTGKEYDPTSYCIKDGYCLRFSSEKLISRLDNTDRQSILEFIEKNDHPGLLNFIVDQLTDEDLQYKIPVSPTVSNTYHQNYGNMRNQLLIGEMYRSGSNFQSVIPGSSLKGAIRTAIISKYGERIHKIEKYKFAEKEILGHYDAKNDPFRAVHVTDCYIQGKKSSMIGSFLNYKERRRRGDDFSSMQMFKEYLIGYLLGGDSLGKCEISFSDELQSINKTIHRWEPIRLMINENEIINACNQFYIANCLKEYEKFYEKSGYSQLRENGRKVIGEVRKIDPNKNECLVRLGRFSQVENVTIEKHRNPSNKRGWGNTRTLTENLYPSGLVKLSFMN